MNYQVKSIDYQDCKEWFLKKHYAKRIPSVSYCFGLFQEIELIGVCSIGKPASPFLCIGICGKEYSDYVYELNRLIVIDNLPKNSLSYFVGRVLRMLPNMILVSYADTKQNHHGYIYQATNFLYTGATKERTDIGSEDGTHSRHYALGETERKFRSSKHRYVYFLGSKTQKKKFIKSLRYEIQPYPKGDNKIYDASYQPTIQLKLL
jgi:hypothetical protein